MTDDSVGGGIDAGGGSAARDGGDVTSSGIDEAVDGLVSRLSVIDQQPLDQRAQAFGQLHDELRSALDGPGSSSR